jgi:hypothetical protein
VCLQVLSASSSVTLNGQVYSLLPLNLFYSYDRADNFVATNSTPPDSSYVVSFNDGQVLTTQAPGTVPLQASDLWLCGPLPCGSCSMPRGRCLSRALGSSWGMGAVYGPASVSRTWKLVPRE